jgi:hypothetical protein
VVSLICQSLYIRGNSPRNPSHTTLGGHHSSSERLGAKKNLLSLLGTETAASALHRLRDAKMIFTLDLPRVYADEAKKQNTRERNLCWKSSDYYLRETSRIKFRELLSASITWSRQGVTKTWVG